MFTLEESRLLRRMLRVTGWLVAAVIVALAVYFLFW
jgi:Mn2+/Fe2+ NRAMP family transporter